MACPRHPGRLEWRPPATNSRRRRAISAVCTVRRRRNNWSACMGDDVAGIIAALRRTRRSAPILNNLEHACFFSDSFLLKWVNFKKRLLYTQQSLSAVITSKTGCVPAATGGTPRRPNSDREKLTVISSLFKAHARHHRCFKALRHADKYVSK